jgi:hypothetical protein
MNGETGTTTSNGVGSGTAPAGIDDPRAPTLPPSGPDHRARAGRLDGRAHQDCAPGASSSGPTAVSRIVLGHPEFGYALLDTVSDRAAG